MLKLVLLLLTFYISIANLFAQVPLLINKATADVFLSFNENELLPITELESLEKILNSEIDDIEFEKEFAVKKSAYDSLRNHFKMFESECRNVSSDSSLVLFNQWYLHFSNVFYQYRKAKFFSSDKIKILFFSTSMSCHCTLEMCKYQLIEILNFISRKGGCPCSGHYKNIEYDYLVVDAYENNELQIKYETFFSPAVILLDGNNRVLFKIEYEENMIDQLKNYLREEI